MNATMASNFNLGWRASARLRYGMFWRRHTPTLHDYPNLLPRISVHTLLMLLVLVLWGWAMDRDYAEEQITVAIKAEQRAAMAQAILVDCLNGRAAWTTEGDNEMVACDKAWMTKLK